MILDHELTSLNAINNTGLWMRSTAPDHEMIALDVTNNSGL